MKKYLAMLGLAVAISQPVFAQSCPCNLYVCNPCQCVPEAQTKQTLVSPACPAPQIAIPEEPAYVPVKPTCSPNKTGGAASIPKQTAKKRHHSSRYSKHKNKNDSKYY